MEKVTTERNRNEKNGGFSLVDLLVGVEIWILPLQSVLSAGLASKLTTTSNRGTKNIFKYYMVDTCINRNLKQNAYIDNFKKIFKDLTW